MSKANESKGSKESAHSTASPAHSSAPLNDLEAARAAARGPAMALAPDRVHTFNMDAPFVWSIVHNAWPQVFALMSSMTKLDGFDQKLVEVVPVAAKALLLVDGRIPRKTATGVRLQQAFEARRTMISAVQPLADRALIDAELVSRASAGNSFLDVGNGLVMLCSELTNKWSSIQGKTVVEPHEIESALELGYEMLVAATPRREAEVPVNQLEDERARLATLVSNGWSEVRAALGWIRRHERDRDVIAPSLYARKNGGRPSSEARDEGDEPAQPVVQRADDPEVEERQVPQDDPFVKQ